MTIAETSAEALFGKTRIGLGCMGLTGLFGPIAPKTAVATIHRALEVGIRHFDTAELYGPFVNEEILASALVGRQEDIVVATKIGYRYQNKSRIGLDGRPESLRVAVEGCLRRLKRECIDLLYLHRQDPAVPIEASIDALASFVTEGKVRGIGLSAADLDTVTRARRVARIAVVQNEYSLLCRSVESQLLPDLSEAGIGLVAYSPLVRGLLSGDARNSACLSADDYRLSDSRFEPTRFAGIQQQLLELKAIAANLQVSVEAVAIAWLLTRGVFTIPGCRRPEQIDSIIGATQIRLSSDELSVLDGLDDQVAACQDTRL